MTGRTGVALAVAAIAVSASAAAASAATTPAVATPTNRAHAAAGRLLLSVALPVNFAPEGIAKGEGVGLKADVPDHLLFVCGGTTGTAHVYHSRTGALVAQYQFGPNGKSLINDVVLTPVGPTSPTAITRTYTRSRHRSHG